MVRLFLCECGPIIRDAVDLDSIEAVLSKESEGLKVRRHSTLCSEEGRRWLEAELGEAKDDPAVLAACSPREHATTFQDVCQKAGYNYYLLSRANIREQCGWVTADRRAATVKAEALIRAAVARCRRQIPLACRQIECVTDVLVLGTGVAGLSAARVLAQAGRRVFLVEWAPCVGGKVMAFGEVFPDLECASCMLEPLVDEVLHHPDIELFTYGELEAVSGYFGNFTATIRRKARHIDPQGCYGCGTCHTVCPVEVPNRFDDGTSKRKAVYIPYVGALPSVSVVDEKACLHFQGGGCDACVAACPFGNIDLDETDELMERRVGAIIIATGAEPVDLEPFEGAVVTASTLESLLNVSGPTSGMLTFPSARPPASIGIIHCVGPDLKAPSERCSEICCAALEKYERQIRKVLPECDITVFSFDRCHRDEKDLAAGGQTDRRRVFRLGTKPLVVTPGGIDGMVRVSFTWQGRPRVEEVEMAVVAPPLNGGAGTMRAASLLRLPLDERGFVAPDHKRLRPFASRVEGVFVAGGASGPKDIREAATQGAAAAGSALAQLVPGRMLTIEPLFSRVDQKLCGGCRLCQLVCPYNAISFDETSRVSVINDLICRGCGCCAAACPSSAIIAQQFTDDQLMAEIEVYAGERATPDGNTQVKTEGGR